MYKRFSLLTILFLLLASCSPAQQIPFTQTPNPTATPLPPTEAPTDTPDPTATDTPEPTASYTPTAAPTDTPVPFNCNPGDSITDEAGDVSTSYVDLVGADTQLDGETLTVVLSLQDLPETIVTNRTGLDENRSEYEWNIYINVDGQPSTGCTWSMTGCPGAEYSLSLMHFKHGAADKSVRFDQLQSSLWEYNNDSGMRRLDTPIDLQVDTEANTITLTAGVPGITSDSVLSYVTRNANPGGSPVEDAMLCRK